MRIAPPVQLHEEDRSQLQALARARSLPARAVERDQIVLLAAMGVFGTGTGWPDVMVAAIMGGLGLWGGWQIVSQAWGELCAERAAPLGVAAE